MWENISYESMLWALDAVIALWDACLPESRNLTFKVKEVFFLGFFFEKGNTSWMEKMQKGAE